MFVHPGSSKFIIFFAGIWCFFHANLVSPRCSGSITKPGPRPEDFRSVLMSCSKKKSGYHEFPDGLWENFTPRASGRVRAVLPIPGHRQERDIPRKGTSPPPRPQSLRAGPAVTQEEQDGNCSQLREKEQKIWGVPSSRDARLGGCECPGWLQACSQLWFFGMTPGMSPVLMMCLKGSPLAPGAFTTIPSGFNSRELLRVHGGEDNRMRRAIFIHY